MEFEGLEALQRRLRELRQLQSKSLAEYFVNSPSPEKGVGFRHLLEAGVPESEIKASIASTATCIVSLVNSGAWRHEKEKIADGRQWFEHSTVILEQISQGNPEEWVSSKLPPGNPFTVAFRLEAIKALREYAEPENDLFKMVSNTISNAESLLISTLKKNRSKRGTPDQYAAHGAAHIEYYPPTTFLTQLVVRSLKERLKQETDLAGEVESWCRRQIEHELALQGTPSSARDPLALAYAVTTFLAVADTDNLSPTDVTIVGRAIDCFFAAQLDDGSWPRSKPLHHYPQFGNAYCHEYETIAQLLQAPHVQPNLINHLDKLERCIGALDSKANTLPNGGKAWSSGHHPQIHGAESWSTASVFQFVYRLDRLVAEAIRKSVFRYVASTYEPPDEINSAAAEFNPKDFLDSTFRLGEKQVSLRLTVQNDLLRPILAEVHQVIRGEKLSRKTSIAAILFGPPGTSKTQLAKLIAIHLGWPRLDIDPSHLFRSGSEQIQSESNRIFNMLAALERTVVFFDEFDELTRERTSEKSDLASRFLTTAMLPKLSRIADQRKIVFLLATNHIEDFDFAISRPGRFDMLLPVMPPSLEQKFSAPRWQGFRDQAEPIMDKEVSLPAGNRSAEKLTIRRILESLTFDEFGTLYDSTRDTHANELFDQILDAWSKSTLGKQRVNTPDESQIFLDFYDNQSRRFARLKR
jgi:adenylate kinase family enzyme